MVFARLLSKAHIYLDMAMHEEKESVHNHVKCKFLSLNCQVRH